MVKIIVVVRPGSAKRSIKMRLCSLVGALWCSKVPPDTCFGDFQSDFGWIWHVFQNVFVALPLPKNLRSIVSPIRGKTFRNTFLARPGHKICTDSHNPSAAFLLEGRRFHEASSIRRTPTGSWRGSRRVRRVSGPGRVYPSLPSRRPPQDRRPLPSKVELTSFFRLFSFFSHAKKR